MNVSHDKAKVKNLQLDVGSLVQQGICFHRFIVLLRVMCSNSLDFFNLITYLRELDGIQSSFWCLGICVCTCCKEDSGWFFLTNMRKSGQRVKKTWSQWGRFHQVSNNLWFNIRACVFWNNILHWLCQTHPIVWLNAATLNFNIISVSLWNLSSFVSSEYPRMGILCALGCIDYHCRTW